MVGREGVETGTVPVTSFPFVRRAWLAKDAMSPVSLASGAGAPAVPLAGVAKLLTPAFINDVTCRTNRLLLV